MNKNILFLVGIFLISVQTKAQVGIGTRDPKATLDIVAENNVDNVDGILIPRITKARAIQMSGNTGSRNVQNSTLVYIYDTSTADNGVASGVDEPGFYHFKASGDTWIKVIDEDDLKKSSPQFFYMPSVILPINRTSTDYVTYESSDDTYIVDLYKAFKLQFNNPIISSNNSVPNVVNTSDKLLSTSSLTGFVKNRNAYEYHILAADDSIFPHSTLVFESGAGNEGKLKYKVNPATIATNSAFMNIVLKVK